MLTEVKQGHWIQILTEMKGGNIGAGWWVKTSCYSFIYSPFIFQTNIHWVPRGTSSLILDDSPMGWNDGPFLQVKTVSLGLHNVFRSSG